MPLVCVQTEAYNSINDRHSVEKFFAGWNFSNEYFIVIMLFIYLRANQTKPNQEKLFTRKR